MNRFFLLLLSVFLSACGGHSISQSTVDWNVENYSGDAIQAYDNEDWVLAHRLFTRALNLYQSIDDQSGVLASRINLVEVALSSNNYQVAKDHLAWLNNRGKQQPRVILLNGVLAMKQKQMSEASAVFQQVLPEFDGVELLNPPDSVQLAAIASRTKLAFEQKKNELIWTQRYANALDKTVNLNDNSYALLLRFQARLLSGAGSYEKVEKNLQQALLIYKSSQSRQGIAMTLFELGQFYEKQKRWPLVLGYLNRSSAVFEYLRNSDMVRKIVYHINMIDAEQTIIESNK